MDALQVFTRRSELTDYVRACKAAKKTIGFVPTMGALHHGHGSLMAESAKNNDITLLSIFVNPKQFGPNEDFSRYPRTFQNDLELAKSFGANAVFAPTVLDMYGKNFVTKVSVPELSNVMCGAFRPGHFDGVCVVVLLLLNLAQADHAYFGLKDVQQFVILKKMCEDLAHPTTLVGMPTIRDEDGLASSSRNRYLTESARAQALVIPKALGKAASLFLSGKANASDLKKAAEGMLAGSALNLQYLDLRSFSDLKTVEDDVTEEATMAVAGFIQSDTGPVRLIDNIILSRHPRYTEMLEKLVAAVQ